MLGFKVLALRGAVGQDLSAHHVSSKSGSDVLAVAAATSRNDATVPCEYAVLRAVLQTFLEHIHEEEHRMLPALRWVRCFAVVLAACVCLFVASGTVC
jgi:hypothetical protein